MNLERELDHLYAQPLAAFTATRDRRVRELTSGGERDAADVLKKARKPTAAAWAANQLARNERMNVRALLTAGEQLREAQAELMRGGKPDGMRRAEEGERRALAALVDAGRQLIDGDANLRKLESTLRAAAVEPEARELLERGRLTKDLAPSGFGFAGMPAPKRTPRTSAATKKKKKEAEAAAAERRKQELGEARAALQEAKKRAQAAEREAVKARTELDKIEEQVRELERSSK